MTNTPELISRLRAAVHEESVLISPRTSKLIEEVKFVIGVLEGEAGLPAGEMVERAARAICTENGIDPDDTRERFLPGSYQTSEGEPHWHGYIDHARAAIEAMREPTEAMENAAITAKLDIYWNYEAAGRPGGPEDVYRAMIDAALAPGRAPNQDPPHE